MTVGRPKGHPEMSVEELERFIAHCGSVSAAAWAADCSRSYLQKFRSGKRPISQKTADAARALLGCTQNPL